MFPCECLGCGGGECLAGYKEGALMDWSGALTGKVRGTGRPSNLAF